MPRSSQAPADPPSRTLPSFVTGPSPYLPGVTAQPAAQRAGTPAAAAGCSAWYDISHSPEGSSTSTGRARGQLAKRLSHEPVAPTSITGVPRRCQRSPSSLSVLTRPSQIVHHIPPSLFGDHVCYPQLNLVIGTFLISRMHSRSGPLTRFHLSPSSDSATPEDPVGRNAGFPLFQDGPSLP
eukprot:CAMPEP_0173110466 /NCGR_PEP_ID=MMETSP1102-20130122/44344_1 /TAXON_ID=49646 /ORGANISM="Geminigera sp., Strain Caron Lab Isolate" /LENGTH=180 /DNA_ID=CAMNT_0014010161 /DNA_START=1069 /DNA_END=1614 /DNA_ORIENTATION=-